MPYAKPIVLSMGDPHGIAPEITHKAWLNLRQTEDCFFIIANPKYYPQAKIITDPKQAAQVFANHLPILALDENSDAKTIIKSIELGVELVQSNQAPALVTNPIAKHKLYQTGFKHAGHTEFLAHLTGIDKPVMMLMAQDLKVALVSIHIAIKHVPNSITKDAIMQTARILDQALKRDFGISKPRIALCGLNPHAGENGAMGREEIEIINPAAEELRRAGINISDAMPADTMFHQQARETYDAALAMYHDQGLIPVKSLDFYGGVNTTLGLPIIRTSPDHGTGFDIAGKNIARPDSLVNAIKTARKMAQCRANYDKKQ